MAQARDGSAVWCDVICHNSLLDVVPSLQAPRILHLLCVYIKDKR